MRQLANLALVLGLLACSDCATPSGPAQPSASHQGVFSGTVTYRERAALPPNALVTVRLWDALEPPSTATVGEVKFPAQGEVPLPFELFFDPGLIQPTHPYGARARITAEGVTLYESTTPVSVLTQGAPSVGVELVVKRVAPP